MLILNVIDNGLGLQSFDYDISPILQEFYSLKMGCTTKSIIFGIIAFIEIYHFLCV